MMSSPIYGTDVMISLQSENKNAEVKEMEEITIERLLNPKASRTRSPDYRHNDCSHGNYDSGGMNLTMELTPAEKHLIKWLKIMKCSEDEAVGIMLVLDTPEKRDTMMMWMAEHLEATPSDLIGKTLDIAVGRN